MDDIDKLEEEYSVQREYYPNEVAIDDFIVILEDAFPAFIKTWIA